MPIFMVLFKGKHYSPLKGGPMLEKTKWRVALLLAVLFAGALHSQTIPFPTDSVKGPMCVVIDSTTNVAVPLSPKRSIYNVVVTDGLARITLTQHFINDYGTIADIAYVFPLPHDAAVHAMRMEYRDSIYSAEIYEKEEAKEIYDSIVNEGGVAALLLQERPNVFQQRLANIAFNESAWIEIKLTMPLSYDNGVYELAIPTMVAERFQSEGASPVPSSGRLWNPPPDRDGQSLQVNVLLQTGFPIANLQSPTHPLNISQIEAVREELQTRGVLEESTNLDLPYNQGALLQQSDTYPNKDFVLRFSRSAAELDFTVASYYDTEEPLGYFYSNIFPDTSLFDGGRPDLDIVLLIDHSGSQDGWPMQKEKEIASQILGLLTENDRFTVIAFESSVRWCFNNSQSVPANGENIETARSFINGLTPMGGTNLLAGVESALAIAADESKSRFFIFLTDGFITNEDAILQAIKEHPTSPTIFTFGCGDNLNRYFLDEAAKVGNGVSTELTGAEEVGPVVNTVWNKIESPQLKNIEITCSGLDRAQLIMPNGTMLYKGSPVTIFGVYAEGGPHTVTIAGDRNGETITLEKDIDLADGPTANSMIPQVWAKQMISKLRVEEGTTDRNKNHIIELSKQYQVLSDYTAFLAISPEVVTEDNSISESVAVVNDLAKDIVANYIVRICNSWLTIEAPEGIFIREIAVYDLAGRCVFRMKVADTHCRKFSWDGIHSGGQRISRGHFVVAVRTTRGLITRKVIWK